MAVFPAGLWIQLRVKQFGRILQSIGIPLLVILLFVLGGLALALLEKLKSSSTLEIAGFVSLFPLAIHVQRKDHRALQLLHLSPRQIYLAEYLLISFVLSSLLALFYGKWLILVYSLGFALILSQIPVLRQQAPNRSWWKLSAIPPLAFEWRMGWRQYYWMFLPLIVIGVSLSFFTAAPIVAMLVIAFIAVGFFEPIEPKEWLVPFWHAPYFLLHKWWANWKVYLLLTSPLSVSFFTFHISYWQVGLATLTLTGLLFFFLIGYKYTGYWPGRQRVYNQTATGLFLLGFVSLFFLPVSIFFLWRYYRKAGQQLQHYHPKITSQ